MSYKKFSRSFRRQVCIEYMQSGMSRKEIAVKYGLPSVNTVSGWINSSLSPVEIKEKCASLPQVTNPEETMMEQKETNMTADQLSTIDALQKQIAKLEKELKYAQDKNLALNTLIDIAEEQGIRIRKKSGVKQ